MCPAGVLEAVQMRDVGVVQRREHLRLAAEAREPFGVARDELRQDFQRDVAMEFRVAGAVDLAHAACAKRASYFVRTDSRASR